MLVGIQTKLSLSFLLSCGFLRDDPRVTTTAATKATSRASSSSSAAPVQKSDSNYER